jgi:hypothetical protein
MGAGEAGRGDAAVERVGVRSDDLDSKNTQKIRKASMRNYAFEQKSIAIASCRVCGADFHDF